MNKFIYIVALLITVSLMGCNKTDKPPAVSETQQEDSEPQQEEAQAERKTRIGIMTGAASESGHEFFAAQNMKSKYGDMIETATYSDGYKQNPDALTKDMLELAGRGVDAIVLVRAVNGAAAAIDKLRETYPDMLVICGAAEEEPELIAPRADIIMNLDDIGMGRAISWQAKKMGAKTLVHYTFPRHMADETLSGRRDLLRSACEEYGIQFVDATLPDTENEGGIEEARQFIVDDVPRKVENYGKDTAFYSTSCDIQVELIRMIIQEGALYPQQCHPSPYHAYPEALRIELPDDRAGDAAYLIELIQEEITVKGGNGRFSTWPAPINMLFVEAGVEYAIAYMEGVITDRNDTEALGKICSYFSGDADGAILTECVTESGITLKNFYLVLSGYVNF